MRTLIVQEFMTLDGVMQAPGGAEEDSLDGFRHGGWAAPYFAENDAVLAAVMRAWMQPMDILLGRKTFKIWAPYWPAHDALWPGINKVAKYVLSRTLAHSDWQNTVFLQQLEDVRKIKAGRGGAIKVHGSAQLVQALLAHDLADELQLMIFPLLLGQGKRLFAANAVPAAYALKDHAVTASGVIFAHYVRGGAVEMGHLG